MKDKKYRVVVVGYGKRGENHVKHFRENDNFEILGVCDKNKCKLSDRALNNIKLGTNPNEIAEIASRNTCDVFCICTPPDARYDLIRLGIECGAKLIAIEKPLALTTEEGFRIKNIIDKNKIKAIVCHQHRYGSHYKKIKEIVKNGEIGHVNTIYSTATGWATHMLPHLANYMLWYNDNIEAEWVMAQAAGKKKFEDNHPSPDYLAGFINFSNKIRGIVECGAGAPDVREVDYWWHKCRFRIVGDEGFAEVLTGGGWRSANKDGINTGKGSMNYDLDMPPYIQDIAKWLDDSENIHPCNFKDSFHSFEISMALWQSVISGCQISLPLIKTMDEVDVLYNTMPTEKVLLSSCINADNFS